MSDGAADTSPTVSGGPLRDALEDLFRHIAEEPSKAKDAAHRLVAAAGEPAPPGPASPAITQPDIFEPLDAVAELIRLRHPGTQRIANSLTGLAPPVGAGSLAMSGTSFPQPSFPQTSFPVGDGAAERQRIASTWSATDLSDAVRRSPSIADDAMLLAQIAALAPHAAALVQLRQAALQLDAATGRALLALLGAIATLLRELSDGPLRQAIGQLDHDSLIAALASRKRSEDASRRRRFQV